MPDGEVAFGVCYSDFLKHFINVHRLKRNSVQRLSGSSILRSGRSLYWTDETELVFWWQFWWQLDWQSLAKRGVSGLIDISHI